MITLLTPRVWGEITRTAAGCKEPADVAVAYFGAKGDKLLPLPRGSSLVVDATLSTLATGSTCPAALERLRRTGIDVYSAQHLHAKVYAFDDVAFVGSANTSERSRSTLIEAVIRFDADAAIASARAFVQSLCLTKLSRSDLSELAQYYKPPKFPSLRPSPKQTKYSTLVMELTNEQGGGRESQVQPPKPVWNHYFGIDVGRERAPALSLVNDSTTPALPTPRDVVAHHHNYTIEIAGAELPRPAILQMRRIGRNAYSYHVHRPPHRAFLKMDQLLRTIPNPLRHEGRRWIIL
jgi:hypothetical protein